jgi:hypothetical protein
MIRVPSTESGSQPLLVTYNPPSLVEFQPESRITAFLPVHEQILLQGSFFVFSRQGYSIAPAQRIK